MLSPDCLDEQTITAFVSSELPAAALARVEAHIAGCASCRSIVADAAYGAIATTQDGPAVATEPGTSSKPWAAFVPAPGAVIADTYRVESILGHGGMGAVLAARHVERGHRVAIKIMHHGGRTAAARLLREARN